MEQWGIILKKPLQPDLCCAECHCLEDTIPSGQHCSHFGFSLHDIQNTACYLIDERLSEYYEEIVESRVRFGLIQQGHINKIESILSELGSSIYAWEKIGKEIGWDALSAAAHYVTYLRKTKPATP